jgi:hypothetical protein
VLVLTYYNYGICRLKLQKDANETFKHALAISEKFLGQNHYITLKLIKKYESTMIETDEGG